MEASNVGLCVPDAISAFARVFFNALWQHVVVHR
jgi:hypothetical protein